MEHHSTAGSRATWVNQAGSVPACNDRLPLALDTEFMRRNTFYPKLALVQVAHGDDCWLLDPLAYDAGTDLRTLSAGRVCIVHSGGEDMEALAPLLGDAPLDLFDTQIAAALCGMGPGLSYQKLVATLLDVDIPKDETRSDWLQRPLTPGQLDYAAQDVTYLAALHAKLGDELDRRGRSEWLREDCARLAQRRFEHGDPQPQCSFAAAADWPSAAQARLKRVLLWRDAAAHALDKPRPWILDDAHALSLAHEPPATTADLFERVKGQRALRGPQRNELFARLNATAGAEELEDLAPIHAGPHGEAKHAVDAMRTVVKSVAEAADLPAGLLCPRRLIEQFATTRAWPAALHGWRASLLEAKLTTLLPG